MSLDKTFNIQRLKGQENYQFWSLRIASYLVEKGYNKAIEEENTEQDDTIKAKALALIRLSVEDGPLL